MGEWLVVRDAYCKSDGASGLDAFRGARQGSGGLVLKTMVRMVELQQINGGCRGFGW